MDDIGFVSLLLLLGIGFALYVGSDYQYAPTFMVLTNYLVNNNTEGIVDLILTNVTSFVTIGSITLAGILSFTNSKAIETALGAVLLTALVTIFITPFTFYQGVITNTALTPLSWLITIFFNILLVIAVVNFVTGKTW